MENLDKKVNEVLEATEDFTKLKNELLGKLQQDPEEEVIKQYSNRFHIDLDSAKARLQENYKKEIDDVNHKEIALRLSNAFKVMSPKLMGLVFREKDREQLAKEAINTANRAREQVSEAVNLAKAAAKDQVIDTIRALDLGRLATSFVELGRQNEVLRRNLENLESRVYYLEGTTVSQKTNLLTRIKNNFRYFWN